MLGTQGDSHLETWSSKRARYAVYTIGVLAFMVGPRSVSYRGYLGVDRKLSACKASGSGGDTPCSSFCCQVMPEKELPSCRCRDIDTVEPCREDGSASDFRSDEPQHVTRRWCHGRTGLKSIGSGDWEARHVILRTTLCLDRSCGRQG